MKIRLLALLVCLVLLFTGCVGAGEGAATQEPTKESNIESSKDTPKETEREAEESQGEVADLGDDSKTFGNSLDGLGAYNGYFEGESQSVVVECISGTKNAYKLVGNTLTFTAIGADSVYSISGIFRGNIVINVGDDYKFDLELHGLS